MTYREFVHELKENGNDLISESARVMDEWKDITRTFDTKGALENLLTHNIMGISFRNSGKENKVIVACSNKGLISVFSSGKGTVEEKNLDMVSAISSNGIRSKSKDSVLTWDFLTNDFCTVRILDNGGRQNFSIVNPIIGLDTPQKKLLDGYLRLLLSHTKDVKRQITRNITNKITRKITEKA